MKTTIERLLNKVCLDERISSGIFLMEDNTHLDILQEYLEKYGLTKEEATAIRNKMFEGKYPERQAYNKDGLLVTFPTPAYKQRALARGTHFDKNPTKGQAFAAKTQPSAPVTTDAQPTTPTEPAPTSTEKPSEPVVPTPATTEPSTPAPSEPTPAAEVPVTGSLPVEQPKTPEQKKAETEYVEKILTTENTTIQDITVSDAKNFGWKQTMHGEWYDKSGTIKAKNFFNDKLNMQVIRLI